MDAAANLVPPLTGKLVRLEPLGEQHIEDLVVAAAADRATFGYADVPDANADAVAEYVRRRLRMRAVGFGEWSPFAQVRLADGRAMGSTMLGNLRRRTPDAAPFAAEIGGTWLGAEAQRSGINVEAKLLMLTYAFETWQVGRIDIKTDARNDLVRIAITKLGAEFEGVLRAWQPSQRPGEEDGLRDSAMFSIVAGEWPAVRDRLNNRLAAHG